MKISLLLKSIITPSYILYNPHQLHQTASNIYQFTLPSNIDSLNIDSLNNIDLPINYDTIKTMMLMSYNAYMEPDDPKWEKIEYNNTDISVNPKDIQAYLFSDETKKFNVIAIKGTTISYIPMILSNFKSPAPHDKYNDNLFFSCCFYKQSKLFKNFCDDDNSNKYECNKECYKNSTQLPTNYLNMLNILIKNVQKEIDFENSNIYFTGHSLGGFLATSLGLSYNKQVITFDSPGGKHFFDLTNFDYSNDKKIYNFGHNADSIMHGHCGTLCWTWGYIVETECHVGNSCIYDSKEKLGMSDSLRSHQLEYIINNILPNWKSDFPECKYRYNCTDLNCEKWSYH